MTEKQKIKNKKIEMLKAMNLIIQSINNWAASTDWELDCLEDPDEKDFSRAASNRDKYRTCCETFIKTIIMFGKDGFCTRLDEDIRKNRPSSDVYQQDFYSNLNINNEHDLRGFIRDDDDFQEWRRREEMGYDYALSDPEFTYAQAQEVFKRYGWKCRNENGMLYLNKYLYDEYRHGFMFNHHPISIGRLNPDSDVTDLLNTNSDSYIGDFLDVNKGLDRYWLDYSLFCFIDKQHGENAIPQLLSRAEAVVKAETRLINALEKAANYPQNALYY